MVTEIIAAFERVEKDIDVQVVVLTGNGKYFCTGMDLQPNAQAEMSEKLKDGSVATLGAQMFESIRACSKPTIAKVNGPAMGGGWGLFFCTDIRVVVKNAFFTFSEVKRGVVPAIISAFITPQLGLFQTKQLMVSGKRVSAEEGYRLGFVSSVADNSEQLDKLTQGWIDELMENGPQAMARVKRAVQYIWQHSHEENRKYVEGLFAETVHAPEALYGMGCFMQKIKPNWGEFAKEQMQSKL